MKDCMQAHNIIIHSHIHCTISVTLSFETSTDQVQGKQQLTMACTLRDLSSAKWRLKIHEMRHLKKVAHGCVLEKMLCNKTEQNKAESLGSASLWVKEATIEVHTQLQK